MRQTIRYYAIKSVEKHQKPRVLQEVKAMHVLDHPLVLHFYAWYETTNHLWLILEYCVGGSLYALLKQDARLPEPSIHDFGRDLAASLHHLHAEGFIYCDLKPSNILLDENGRIKLGGFGLSRKLSEINRQWQSGQLLPTARHGTPCYIAPELFMEGAVHSTKSDMWSLGCVLFEMAAGRPPFVAPTLAQLVHDILNADPPTLDHVSPEFASLVHNMLDKNPYTRCGWELVASHPFWKSPLVARSTPKEPALAAFIERHKLRALDAAEDDVRASQALAASARQSVNISRISQIASRNLIVERGEGEGGAGYANHRGGRGATDKVGDPGSDGRARGGAPTGGSGASTSSAVSHSASTAAMMSAAAHAAQNQVGSESARAVGTLAGDVALDNTDAELDFVEHREEHDPDGVDPGDPRQGGAHSSTASTRGPRTDGGEEEEAEARERGRAGGTTSAGAGQEGRGPGHGDDEGGGGTATGADAGVLRPQSTPQEGAKGEAHQAGPGRPESAPGPDASGKGCGGGGGDTFARGSAPALTEATTTSTARTGDAVARLDSTPGDARPTATPLLGVNPRLDGAASGGGGEEDSRDFLGGVRANMESLGATRSDLVPEDVIWHASDAVVKPIVGNRRVERILDPKWEAGALPFRAMTLSEVLMAPAASLEAFLQQVYAALASSAASAEKINVLAYFESLCGDPGTANVLINSSLMTLFVRLLKSDRSDRLRVRLASVIGKLIRHATYIADELAGTGILDVLSEVLKDKSERVRRRAMGALGELLFFCATQQHDRGGAGAPGQVLHHEHHGGSNGNSGGDSVASTGGTSTSSKVRDPWEVPGTVLSQVVRCLRQGEDEVVQHYAIKAIENIATQGGEWGFRFATPEVAFHTCQIVSVTKQDALRGTAASALCRLCRVNHALLPFVVDKCGTRMLVLGLTDSSSKSQGASVTMLCLAVANDSLQARVKAQLLEDRSLIGGLHHLLASPLAVLQAKAVTATALLARHSMGVLARLGQKFFDRLDKLSREREPYLRASIAAFRVDMRAQLQVYLGLVKDELTAATRRRFLAGSGTRPGSSASRSALAHTAVVPQLLVCPSTREGALSPALAVAVAEQLELLAAPGVTFAGMAEVRLSLLLTLGALQEQADVLVGRAPLLEGNGSENGLSEEADAERARRAKGREEMVEAVTGRLMPTLATVAGAGGGGGGGCGNGEKSSALSSSSAATAPREAGGGAGGGEGLSFATADAELKFAAVSLLCSLALSANRATGAPLEEEQQKEEEKVREEEKEKEVDTSPKVTSGAGAEVAALQAKMDAAMMHTVLPLLPTILDARGEAQLPLTALKVCVTLLDASPRWIAALDQIGVTRRFFSYLVLDHPNNNVHNMRACRAIVVGGTLSHRDAVELLVVPRAIAVLLYAHESAVDPFLEPVLDLLCSLLGRDQHAIHAQSPEGGLTRPILEATPTLVDLLNHPDPQVRPRIFLP